MITIHEWKDNIKIIKLSLKDLSDYEMISKQQDTLTKDNHGKTLWMIIYRTLDVLRLFTAIRIYIHLIFVTLSRVFDSVWCQLDYCTGNAVTWMILEDRQLTTATMDAVNWLRQQGSLCFYGPRCCKIDIES